MDYYRNGLREVDSQFASLHFWLFFGNMVAAVFLIPLVWDFGWIGILWFLILAGGLASVMWVFWCVQARRDMRRLSTEQQRIQEALYGAVPRPPGARRGQTGA